MNQSNSVSSGNQYATWLRWLLAIIGCGLMVATIPLFFPVALMATIHGWLGLGEFPEAPIAIYLARSTSLLYAVPEPGTCSLLALGVLALAGLRWARLKMGNTSSVWCGFVL